MEAIGATNATVAGAADMTAGTPAERMPWPQAGRVLAGLSLVSWCGIVFLLSAAG